MRVLSDVSLSVAALALTTLSAVVDAGRSSSQHLARSDSPGHRLWKRYTGKGSFYDPETGNQGACGGFIKRNDWVVALNTDQFDGGAHCNQQVTISYGGTTQVATIKDACPGCGYGGLDLTPGLFSAFANQDLGIIQLSWTFGSNGGGGGGGGGGNNNNNGGNGNNWHTTSTTPQWTPEYTPPTTSSRRTSSRRTSRSSTPEWTPTSSIRQWTSSSSRWTPTSSSWTPSETPSSSSSSEWSSSTVSNSTLAAATDGLNSTIANLNSTITTVNATQFENGTIPLPSLPVGGNTTVLPDGTLAAGGSEGGALANMAQVILRVANVIVQAAETS